MQVKQKILDLYSNQKIRFLAVGVLNTVICYFISLAVYAILGERLSVVFIGVILFPIGVTVSFLGHKIISFKSQGAWLTEYLRAYVVNVGMAIINLFLLWLLVDIFEQAFWLAQLEIIFINIVYTYFAHLKFTFRQ